MIEFYIPPSQTIPTIPRLNIDNCKYQVIYTRDMNEFAYTFEFYKWKSDEPITEELALEILDQIVRTMSNESYDHGASWRATSIDKIENEYTGCPTYKVKFRIRDGG
jgi:hypothetical protein